MSDHALPWRTGRTVGRTIYAHDVGPEGEPIGEGRLIGTMDTPMLAAEAVAAHNERRARLLAAAQGHAEGP